MRTPAFNLEAKLSPGSPAKRIFAPGQINRLFSSPVPVRHKTVPLSLALEDYKGRIATDLSYIMTAADHTAFVMNSLDRLSRAGSEASALKLYDQRGAGDICRSLPSILHLNSLYRSLGAADERALWLGAALHDIGKATGQRDLHPQTGAELFDKTPALQKRLLDILGSFPNSLPREKCLELVQTAIRWHDVIGGIGITREHNIFSRALSFAGKTDPEKNIVFAALINFADIDGQGPNGILSGEKVKTFTDAVRLLSRLAEDAAAAKGAPPAQRDLIGWGKSRAAAWIRGDTPGWDDSRAEKVIDEYFRGKKQREAFLLSVAEIEHFDLGYNLGTLIADPPSAVGILDWIMSQAKNENALCVTVDRYSFFHDEKGSQETFARFRESAPAEKLFSIEVMPSHGQKTLHLGRR